MHVSELFSEEDLLKAIEDKMVTQRKHPQWDLWIYNYTPQAQYSRTWNDVTINCRGLILDGNADIVARPFKKFFNYGEEQVDLAPDTPVKAFDKADGSLGIIYPTPDGKVSVATRGSFESDQALWATDHLKSKNLSADDFFNIDEITYLCEIVYPENRIVLDYGNFAGLIGLASVDINTGKAMNVLPAFAFDRYVEHFPEITTLKEALSAPDRWNSEGLVLRLEDGTHVKIKQEDYVKAHKIVTGLNERTIWEAMREGGYGGAMDMISELPDEFHAWAEEVSTKLWWEFCQLEAEVIFDHATIVTFLDDNYTRKEFAQEAINNENKSAMFLIEDERMEEMRKWVWDQIRP